ncbi:hypothetical protein [Nostoc sp. NMS9]|uniref:hypothetical protein n=1 Tax=Nostoc sp. NMS9 TaxID=2815393 RepID=UPI0025D42075|nr:hypothetical protein [Nostoc sp. NMS9]MBN3944550.1 hypothetical protein [Nostoc sp. NMS9]
MVKLNISGLTQTIAEKNDFYVGAIHELPLPPVLLRKSYIYEKIRGESNLAPKNWEKKRYSAKSEGKNVFSLLVFRT